VSFVAVIVLATASFRWFEAPARKVICGHQ
jgi:hypothetical protein